MRWILLFLSLSVSVLNAQKFEYVTNTSVIRAMNMGNGETLFDFRSYPGVGNCVVYYDTSKSQIAFTISYRAPDNYDYDSWYRDGSKHRFVTAVPENPNICDVNWWYPNGQLMMVTKKNADSSIVHHYFNDGKLFFHSKGWGKEPWKYDFSEETFWDSTGNVTQKVVTCPDSIIRRFYYPNRNVSLLRISYPHPTLEKANYKHYEEAHHENGTIALKGYFIFLKGEKRHGTWSYYNNAGKLIKEEYYEEGKLVRTVEH